VVRDDQPDAREGQAGRRGDAERFVVPLKPGNAGGGKGPPYVAEAELRGDSITLGSKMRFIELPRLKQSSVSPH
jgi:hypothetical protein